MPATPILDLERDPPSPGRSEWWKWIFGLAVGAAIGIAAGETDLGLPPINIVAWLPGLYIMIAIHELAHLAVGYLTGMPPGGIMVGGFVLMRSGDRWNFRFDRRRIFGGGMAVPLTARDDFRVGAFAWMVAAGPVASLITTVACWLAYQKYGSGTWDWIGSFFWASAIGLLSIIPMSAGLHKSDAARLWELWTKPERAKGWMALVAIQSESMRGVRPRDWDATLTAQMLASPSVWAQLMGYYRHLDENDEDAALDCLEAALVASASSGKPVRQILYLEAAEVCALIRHNPTKARTWRERALKLRKPESVACTDGAIAMSEGRFEDALGDIARTREFAARRKLGSGNGLMRSAMDRLDARESVCREEIEASLAE